jgi:RNase H-like domain found in reverse transcriptase
LSNSVRNNKKNLKSDTLLHFPRPDLGFFVQTDASNVAVGGAIYRIQEKETGEEKRESQTDSLFLVSLKKGESNYSTIEKEIFAMTYLL